MNEKKPLPEHSSDMEEKELNTQLKKRLAIAGGLVAVALAAIPILDNFKTATPTKDTNTSASAPNTNSGRITVPVASVPVAEIIAAASSPVAASAPASATVEPGSPITPANTQPTSPDLSNTPGMHNHTLTATGNGSPDKKTTASVQPTSKPAPRLPTTAVEAVKPAKPQPAPTLSPITPHAIPAQATTEPLPSPSLERTPSTDKALPAGTSVGYNVQLGLFSNITNAEKLLTELKSHGIQAHTETKVQLGPFKTRAQADEAISKLKSLGYKPLLSPAGNR